MTEDYLDWETAPDQFRDEYEKSVAEREQALTDRSRAIAWARSAIADREASQKALAELEEKVRAAPPGQPQEEKHWAKVKEVKKKGGSRAAQAEAMIESKLTEALEEGQKAQLAQPPGRPQEKTDWEAVKAAGRNRDDQAEELIRRTAEAQQ
jgi:hypothetical protein